LPREIVPHGVVQTFFEAQTERRGWRHVIRLRKSGTQGHARPQYHHYSFHVPYRFFVLHSPKIAGLRVISEKKMAETEKESAEAEKRRVKKTRAKKSK
jgi:hypothetical protein